MITRSKAPARRPAGWVLDAKRRCRDPREATLDPDTEVDGATERSEAEDVGQLGDEVPSRGVSGIGVVAGADTELDTRRADTGDRTGHGVDDLPVALVQHATTTVATIATAATTRVRCTPR